MKATLERDPTVVFPLTSDPPDEADLEAALGDAAEPIQAFLAELRSQLPAATVEWKFSARSGWYQIHLLKKRRLFYLIPQRNDFRLSLILGGKALALLKAGPYARQTTLLLKTAQHYPEGTAFSFDRRTFTPDLLVAFVTAKIAH